MNIRTKLDYAWDFLKAGTIVILFFSPVIAGVYEMLKKPISPQQIAMNKQKNAREGERLIAEYKKNIGRDLAEMERMEALGEIGQEDEQPKEYR